MHQTNSAALTTLFLTEPPLKNDSKQIFLRFSTMVPTLQRTSFQFPLVNAANFLNDVRHQGKARIMGKRSNISNKCMAHHPHHTFYELCPFFSNTDTHTHIHTYTRACVSHSYVAVVAAAASSA